jgi:hypothetical protein
VVVAGAGAQGAGVGLRLQEQLRLQELPALQPWLQLRSSSAVARRRPCARSGREPCRGHGSQQAL